MPNHNTHFIVINIRGTSKYKFEGIRKQRRCPCNSWTEHWNNFTGGKRITCAVLGCSRLANRGGHVISTDGRRDRLWWIVPICATHNDWRNRGEMVIDSRSKLVLANMWLTCKKPKTRGNQDAKSSR